MLKKLAIFVSVPLRYLDRPERNDRQHPYRKAHERKLVDRSARDDQIVAGMKFQVAEYRFQRAFAVMDEQALVAVGVLIERLHLIADQGLVPDHILIPHQRNSAAHRI